MSAFALFARSALLIAAIWLPAYASVVFAWAAPLHWENVAQYFSIFEEIAEFYLILPFFVFEIFRYWRRKQLNKNLVADSAVNMLTAVVVIALEIALYSIFLLTVFYWISEHLAVIYLPVNWVTVAACILLADLAYYWEHRASHRTALGWSTHTVHHSSPHYNLTVAYRFGPLDWLMAAIFTIPLLILGFDPLLVFAAELAVLGFQTILHTEIIGKLPRPIELVFNTPSHHRVHHGSNKVYWDKNYAGMLIIWDRLLGSFEAEREKVIYGISRPINSTNFFVVFFHGLTRLWGEMKKARGLKNKSRMLLMHPGWEADK